MSTHGGLTRITTKGLLGSKDYVIDVEPSSPTVLTGANGTGKSTILRVINAISSGDIETIRQTPFREFGLHFRNADPILFSRGRSELLTVNWGEHTTTLDLGASDFVFPSWFVHTLKDRSDNPRWDVESRALEAGRRNGVPMTEIRRVTNMYRHYIHSTIEPGVPEWYAQLSQSLPVLFVTDQRLVVEQASASTGEQYSSKKTSRLAVEAASTSIALQMRRVDTDYARISQKEDRRFPSAVISAMEKSSTVSNPDLLHLIEAVQRKRDALKQVGLLAEEFDYEPKINADRLNRENVRPVIATFLQATLRKMSVLEGLAENLKRFQDFLNSRFTNKSVLLTRTEGLRFRLDSGRILDPGQLSSGEQQVLVLAYEILFSAQKGTLVIVDEPEISLHVRWQDTLIDGLTQIGAPKQLQFLMATHSPILTASHPDLERSLDVDVK